MKAARLREIAWEAIDNRDYEGRPMLVDLDADELAWLLRRWKGGQAALRHAEERWSAEQHRGRGPLGVASKGGGETG